MVYGYTTAERQHRRDDWQRAPKECPHCHVPINQVFREHDNDEPRRHCGADKCRKAASRANLAERKRQERSQARARVLVYCEQHLLDRNQKHAVTNMCTMLMDYSYDEGHQIAEAVIQVIEAQRCKHDRIVELEENAALWKRRALKSEEQLKARIAELEEEMQLFNSLEATIHSIAQRQLARQPDQVKPTPTPAPETDEGDPDRAHTLAVLAQAGIKPYTGGQSQEDEDGPQGDEGEEDEDVGE